MRAVDVVCLALAIGGAAYVFNVKHEAETAHDTRRDLERNISALSRDVGLLEADLAALEQPARLQAVVAGLPEAFTLTPIGADHYIDLTDIPFRSDLIVESEAGEDLVSEPEAPVLAPGAIDLLLQAIVEPQPAAEPVPTVAPAPEASGDGIGALLQSVTGESTP